MPLVGLFGEEISVRGSATFGSFLSVRSSIQVQDSLFVFGSIKVDDSALIEAPVVDGISFSARSFDRLGSSLSIFGFAAAASISGVSVAAGLLGSDTLSAGGYTSLGSGLSVMRGAEIGTTLPRDDSWQAFGRVLCCRLHIFE